MGVVLLILKIIGWTLLAVLGLVFLVLTLVLWVPIRYAGNAVYAERFSAHAWVTWLLKLLRFNLDFEDKQMSYTVRICGIRLAAGKKDGAEASGTAGDEKDADESEDTEDASETADEKAEPADGEAKAETAGGDVKAEETADGAAETADEETAGEEKSGETAGDGQSEENDEETDEETGAGTAVEETASGQKGGKGREMLDKLRHLFIETDRGQRALAHVLKYTGKILKSALPRKGTGYVRFGFSEPDVTGKVLAVLCAAFPQKKRGIELRPEFLESCFECDVTFEGRLILGWLVILLLVLALNRDVLYVIKKLRSK